ncbi:glutathione S-transferase [Xenophilus sp. AP218F]|nr:glutathione S-transferase [Xenophilus sp. AP218F]
MITLYRFGPALGLPDASPFVVKAEMLLKLSGLPYRLARGDVRRAPRGKLPYIDDDGQIIPDSTLIRLHLADKYAISLDEGLDQAQRAVAWSVDCMLGEHFYWGLVYERWAVDEHFRRGPAQWFQSVPRPLRALVRCLIRRKVRRALHVQGTGRFSAEERERLLAEDAAALAALLGDKSFFMGERPSWIDASVYAFVSSALTPELGDTAARRLMLRHPNLQGYAERLQTRYYPSQ